MAALTAEGEEKKKETLAEAMAKAIASGDGSMLSRLVEAAVKAGKLTEKMAVDALNQAIATGDEALLEKLADVLGADRLESLIGPMFEDGGAEAASPLLRLMARRGWLRDRLARKRAREAERAWSEHSWLQKAVWRDRIDFLNLLVDHNWNFGGERVGGAALITAAGSLAMMRLLLEAGVSPTAEKSGEPSALAKMLSESKISLEARLPEWKEMLNELIAHSDPSERKDGLTLSHLAADKPEALRALISRGAEIDVPDAKGRTPLHVAVRSGDTDSALTLIEAGADLHAADSEGVTPMDEARAGIGSMAQTLAAAEVAVARRNLSLMTVENLQPLREKLGRRV